MTIEHQRKHHIEKKKRWRGYDRGVFFDRTHVELEFTIGRRRTDEDIARDRDDDQQEEYFESLKTDLLVDLCEDADCNEVQKVDDTNE